MTDIIGKYAELSLAVDSFQGAGLPVPFEIRRAVEAIEARASQTMSPQQIQSALEHAEAAKTRILNEETSNRHEANEQAADKLMRDMTKGMLGQKDGLTRKELYALRGKTQAKFSRPGEVFNPKKADAAIRKQTGLSLKKYEERMEEIANADSEKLQRLAKRFGSTEQELKSEQTRWRNNRYGYEMRKRQATPFPLKDEVVNVTDDDQRRVEVISAYANHIEPEEQGQMDELHNNIHEESLEDDGMRGDVARAFAESEESNHA